MDHLMELRDAALPGPYGDAAISLALDGGTTHVILGNPESGVDVIGGILTGMSAPERGTVLLDGRPADFDSPGAALRCGCAMSLGVFGPISAAGHVRLLYPGAKPLIWDTGALFEKYLPGISPETPADALDGVDRLALQLLLSAVRGDRLLVLQDPMKEIPPALFDRAARLLDSHARTGCCVVILTHLPRHAKMGRRLTVIKEGAAVFDGIPEDTDLRSLEEMLDIGSSLRHARLRETIPGGVVLEVRGLTSRRRRGMAEVKGVSLEVREGEITGLCAMKGEGGERLLHILAGLEKPAGGRIRLNGNTLKRHAYPFMHASIRYIPPPSPIVPEWVAGTDVRGSLAMQCSRFSSLFVHGMLRCGRLDTYTRFILDEYPIAAEADTPLSRMEPADLRMLQEAPELDRSGSVLLLNHPGEGLTSDKLRRLWECLEEEKVSHTGMVYLTDRVDEAMAICDRIIVMHGGSIVHECDSLNASRRQIALAMSGMVPSDI